MTREEAKKLLRVGDKVRINARCIGDDHEGVEHTLESGCIGKVDAIDNFPAPQGYAVTVWIPVTANESHGIVNVFDETDGDYPFEIVAANIGEALERAYPWGYRSEDKEP